MTSVVSWINITIYAGVIALLAIQVIRFEKSIKPSRKHPPVYYPGSLTKEAYIEKDNDLKKRYHRDWIVYFMVYFVPMILTALSLVSIFDLIIGVVILVSSVIYWIIALFVIKIFDIGIEKK
jgi:hypothetical protein